MSGDNCGYRCTTIYRNNKDAADRYGANGESTVFKEVDAAAGMGADGVNCRFKRV